MDQESETKSVEAGNVEDAHSKEVAIDEAQIVGTNDEENKSIKSEDATQEFEQAKD